MRLAFNFCRYTLGTVDMMEARQQLCRKRRVGSGGGRGGGAGSERRGGSGGVPRSASAATSSGEASCGSEAEHALS